MRKIVLGLFSGLFFVASVLALLAFYDRYWKWRDCFNELGRCYDPATQDVYLEQAGLVWGGFAAIFLGLGAILLLRASRAKRG